MSYFFFGFSLLMLSLSLTRDPSVGWAVAWLLAVYLFAEQTAEAAQSNDDGMFFWKVRYAAIMRAKTRCKWLFCWEAAGCAIDSNPDWRDDTPAEAVACELSYWTE